MTSTTDSTPTATAEAGDCGRSSLAHGSAPSFHRWRIRKELPDGMFSCCEYNGREPVTAEHVRNAPSVREWLGTDKLDEIYHPE